MYLRDAGIGCSKAPTASAQLLKNRIDIIKLITTCFSENLYIPASELKSYLILDKKLAHMCVFLKKGLAPSQVQFWLIFFKILFRMCTLTLSHSKIR